VQGPEKNIANIQVYGQHIKHNLETISDSNEQNMLKVVILFFECGRGQQ
jgi:hypothetical protein